MFKCIVCVGTLIFGLGLAEPAWGGIYSSIDTRDETRYSLDFEGVFLGILEHMKSIPLAKTDSNSAIRRRYIFIEALVGDGALKLDTLEQKINYSAVLIRRGRAVEAARFLEGVLEEDRKNFLVSSQLATALFISSQEPEAVLYMKKSLDHWPTSWGDVKEEQKKFLKSFGWDDEYDFERYRRYETYFQRLIVNRAKEKKQPPLVQKVDPIFVDAKGEPIRFVNEQGLFEASRIAASDKEQLPRDAVEAVEQLLLWLPSDNRLLWLLGEVFNASAMEHKDQKGKTEAVSNAYKIFQRMTNFKTPTNYGLKEITNRYAVLEKYLEANPPGMIAPPVEPPEMSMSDRQWWRVTSVGFITGFAIGLFALWQVQEMRRRRQARAP